MLPWLTDHRGTVQLKRRLHKWNHWTYFGKTKIYMQVAVNVQNSTAQQILFAEVRIIGYFDINKTCVYFCWRYSTTQRRLSLILLLNLECNSVHFNCSSTVIGSAVLPVHLTTHFQIRLELNWYRVYWSPYRVYWNESFFCIFLIFYSHIQFYWQFAPCALRCARTTWPEHKSKWFCTRKTKLQQVQCFPCACTLAILSTCCCKFSVELWKSCCACVQVDVLILTDVK